MRDVFQNIFFNSTEDPLTDYVSCKDLRAIPETIAVWRTHSDRYVELASKLSLCVHFTNLGVRRCSRPLHTAYRRLENYAEYTGIIDKISRKYRGFGKLVEFRLTFEYPAERPSLSREGEIAIYVALPLHIDVREFAKEIEDILIEVAKDILEELGMEFYVYADIYLKEPIYEGAREINMSTAREIPKSYRPFTEHLVISPIGETWCNNIVRCSYDTAYFVLEEKTHGYFYSPVFMGFIPEVNREKRLNREGVLSIVRPIYDRVVERERYW